MQKININQQYLQIQPNAEHRENKLQAAKNAVLVHSDAMPNATIVKGYDFNQGLDYSELFKSYCKIGYQGTNLGISIDIINAMVIALF